MQTTLVAGTHSGCGKTTVTLALLQRLAQRFPALYPFKSGPDFIDPMWHQKAAGRPCYNLDTQMMSAEQIAQTLSGVPESGIAVIEGVMGLFDGRSGIGGPGSTLDLAEKLAAPVLLVINAKGLSGSVAPLVAGFQQYANRLGVQIVGVLANQVGSAHHVELLKGHLAAEGLPPILGWLDKRAPSISERHLGLTLPGEQGLPDFSPHFELDEEGFLEALGQYTPPQTASKTEPKRLSGKQIAVIQDQASCFTYPANLDWLRLTGAEVCSFSVLAGEPIPEGCDALWIPGGYPELHGPQLAASTSWDSIAHFIEQGGYALAECGGMMMLGESIEGLSGQTYPVAGVLPYRTKIEDRLAGLGYRESTEGVKGHEFHHSKRSTTEPLEPAFDLTKGDQGVKYKNLRASYIHWYFASNPEAVARWFGGE